MLAITVSKLHYPLGLWKRDRSRVGGPTWWLWWLYIGPPRFINVLEFDVVTLFAVAERVVLTGSNLSHNVARIWVCGTMVHPIQGEGHVLESLLARGETWWCVSGATPRRGRDRGITSSSHHINPPTQCPLGFHCRTLLKDFIEITVLRSTCEWLLFTVSFKLHSELIQSHRMP